MTLSQGKEEHRAEQVTWAGSNMLLLKRTTDVMLLWFLWMLVASLHIKYGFNTAF